MEETTVYPLATESSWKLKRLLVIHFAMLAWLFGLFYPPGKELWESIDTAFFRWINGSLEGDPTWQLLWACANHKYADWMEDICICLFFFIYIRQARQEKRVRCLAELLFFSLYTAAIISLINKTLLISVIRFSPTIALDNYVLLSEKISWLSVKEYSFNCFPGDHGTTALLFAASFAYFAGKRLGILACIYAAFLCIPRLIVGAHWLSDVLVGSGSIVLFFLSIAFCTPLAKLCINAIEYCLHFLIKWFKMALTFYL